MSAGEDTFAFHLKAHGIPFEREFRFNPERRWRADFFIEPDVLVEIEGGVYTGGRHTRGRGFTSDCEKGNDAVLRGYRYLRFTTEHVTKGLAIEMVQRVLCDTPVINRKESVG